MNDIVTLAQGAGGRQTSELIDGIFRRHLANPDLTEDDAAVLAVPAATVLINCLRFISLLMIFLLCK